MRILWRHCSGCLQSLKQMLDRDYSTISLPLKLDFSQPSWPHHLLCPRRVGGGGGGGGGGGVE